MNMLVALVVLVFISFAAGAPNNCFVLGVEGTTPFPPIGFTSVTLDKLNSSYASAFIAQYNSYGIPYISSVLTSSNCLITLGNMNCVYPGFFSTDYLVPYYNAQRQCIWVNPVSPVQFGTWSTYTYFPVMNMTTLLNWHVTPCPAQDQHYTLLYNNSCGATPTPPPTSAPSGDATCCFYFSHVEKYETALCLKRGSDCPDIGDGYVIVGNTTVKDCNKCTTSSSVMHEKYSIHLRGDEKLDA